MTITFKCPKCGGLCAFADHHAGKRARCINCEQRFIIPSEDGVEAQKEKAEPVRGVPVGGFYHEVFLRSWKIFVKPASTAGLVFVAAAVTFKFFLQDADYSFRVPGDYVVHLPLGWIVTIITWGCLLWYYMEIIQGAAFDMDELPEIDIGAGFEFLWNVFKSIYLFIVAVILAELPFVVIVAILRKMGVEWPGFFRVLMFTGLLSFPMVILTLSTSPQLWLVFRPDYIWIPIVKAFWPYTVTAGIVVVAGVLQWLTVAYSELSGGNKVILALYLAAHLVTQIVVIIAMRTTGLFYRHYSCYFSW